MFQKIKDIKKYIKLAKIGGVVFGVIFIMMIIATICVCIKVHDLKERIEILEKR